MRWWVVLGVTAGCFEPAPIEPDAWIEPDPVIRIWAMPDVRQPRSLTLTTTRGESTETETMAVTTASFPIEHVVAANGQRGLAEIRAEAFDATGTLVGVGVWQDIYRSSGLDLEIHGFPALVNSTHAGDQFLTGDPDAGGLQAAVTASGLLTVVWRDTCTSCNIYARRFDRTVTPVMSALSGDANELVVNTTPAAANATPAVAVAGNTTLVVWDGAASDGSGIGCRALDEQGAATPSQQTIATEIADVVTVSGLPDGNFVVTWQTVTTSMVIRAAIVRPDCTVLAPPFTVSQTSGTSGAHRSHAAARGTSLVYTWIVDGAVYLRLGAFDGALLLDEVAAIPKSSTHEVAYARIVPSRYQGFDLVLRTAASNGIDPGKIEIRLVREDALLEQYYEEMVDVVGSDPLSLTPPAVATAKGKMMVAWQDCPMGAGSCRVSGGYVDSFPTFGTSTANGQKTSPSIAPLGSYFVVTYTDAVPRAPDTSGTSISAQLGYRFLP